MFVDRVDAGRQLAARLTALALPDVVVCGLPRGGVPVAAEVAAALGAPLDVILVRKLGVPVQPELAVGAIGEGGVRVVDDDARRQLGVSPAEVELVERRERDELRRQAERFRQNRPPTPLAGRTVLVVDDGIATGSTVRAAWQVARAAGAARVVVAVPVAPPAVLGDLRRLGVEVVVVTAPPHMVAVGRWYGNFAATSDDEVVVLLGRAAGTTAPPGAGGNGDRPGTAASR